MTPFYFERRVGYVDTDAMGVVHHSNYLRYFEEARVAWLRHRGLSRVHYPLADLCLAVLESSIQHLRPAFFEDLLKVYVQVRRQGLKIYFQYAISNSQTNELLATGSTCLVPLSRDLKPVRIPSQLRSVLEVEPWIETWPSNLFASLRPQL